MPRTKSHSKKNVIFYVDDEPICSCNMSVPAVGYRVDIDFITYEAWNIVEDKKAVHVSLQRKEKLTMKKLSCTRIFEIGYAHELPKHPGKCKRLHGHNAKMEITFDGVHQKDPGMIVDFGDIKEMMVPILDVYDHRCLNNIKIEESVRAEFLRNTDCYIFTENHPPTAENFSLWLMDEINHVLKRNKASYRCLEIKFWETSNCFVTVRDSRDGCNCF